MKKISTSKTLTKKRFEHILEKVFTTPKSGPEEKRTSAGHPSDGYSGKRKNRGKTEDKEGLPSD